MIYYFKANRSNVIILHRNKIHCLLCDIWSFNGGEDSSSLGLWRRVILW